jgi:hypothetical protein
MIEEEKHIRQELLKLGREIAEYNKNIFEPSKKYNVIRIGDLMILETNTNDK